jgi:hypothetical protein
MDTSAQQTVTVLKNLYDALRELRLDTISVDELERIIAGICDGSRVGVDRSK